MSEPFRTLTFNNMADMGRPTTSTPTSNGTIDPYQLMLQKKASGNIAEPTTEVKWPEDDVKKLQLYCAKMGIAGFNSGHVPPLVALSLLKKQIGDDYSAVPLDERLPAGYEKLGTKSQFNCNYPYAEAIKKKIVLHG